MYLNSLIYNLDEGHKGIRHCSDIGDPLLTQQHVVKGVEEVCSLNVPRGN